MRLLPVALVLATLALTGCGTSAITLSSYPNAKISASPTITSMPAGSSQVFTASVSNDPNPVFWSFGYNLSGVSQGLINGGTAGNVTANSITYTAPTTPPIYPNYATPSQQGIATLYANVATDLLDGVSAGEYIAITTPNVTAGILPTTASVALGAQSNFTGYAVGNVNNAVTWQVNGITGGSSTVGTITATGTYTAPTTMPVTGATVTLTLISVADPTKTGTSIITLH